MGRRWVARGDAAMNTETQDPHDELTAKVRKDSPALVTLLTCTPNLRAKFFANPTRAVVRSLPPVRSWDYQYPSWGWLPWRWRPFRYHKERRLLAKQILENVTKGVGDQKVVASVNTDSVFEEYFRPIVRVSQRSFTSVYVLSIAAFVIGIGLIVFGAFVAIHPLAGTNSTVVSSVFGGSGAISALGAVYAMATRGIREATLDHARVRVVLTAFATQLGQLRAIMEQPIISVNGNPAPKAAAGAAAGTGSAPGSPPAAAKANGKKDLSDATRLNDSIEKSMKAALDAIPSPVEISGSSGKASRRRRAPV